MTTTINASTSAGLVQTADTSGSLALQTAGTTAVTIDTSQRVGIGNSSSSPTSLLYLRDTNDITFTISKAGVSNFEIINAGTSGVTLGTQDPYMLALKTNNTERMRIDSGGSLMVGTTSPGGRLTVAGVDSSGSNNALYVKNSSNTLLFQVRDDGWINLGTASVSPYNNTTGNGANMYIATDSSVQRSTSSLKYKTDVVDARFGLADVLKLRAVNYKSKNPSDGDKVFGGLIAEEVEEAGLTEFVIHAQDGTPDALNYSNMVSLAFKAIQELKAINDTQAETLSQQATLINALTARIEALENK